MVLKNCGSLAVQAAVVVNVWFRSCPGCRGSENSEELQAAVVLNWCGFGWTGEGAV